MRALPNSWSSPIGGIVLALALVIAAVAPVRASIVSVSIDPVAPVAREAMVFDVEGEQPTPCFDRIVSDATGLDGDRLTLAYDVVENSGGRPCLTVILPYTVRFEFAEGFSAGDYRLRVIETTVYDAIRRVVQTRDYTFSVRAGGPGVTVRESGWGAIKALYDGRDR